MQITANERNKAVTNLLNGTLISLNTVVPIEYTRTNPRLLERDFGLKFGVLIGITGDVKGKLVLSGKSAIFSKVGEAMYGMPLEGDMLISFSGELGNMIAGGLSTNIIENGIDINITAPTMIQGDSTLSGFKQGLSVTASFDHLGDLDIFLLLD
ncbi:chemotaxis protein CheX [Lentibacillus halodurans]|uniref:Chemotaxis protein CheX n=1 Tax=Lentibacillus halodurans TaxID=237679 RepID=A0A1I1AD50_9BACI|nr:chemotaxis protein CheX [Lentibacillus halodurans]SFB35907.1 chemotaxis protein CheX [Lentibacillus halodurans]